MSRARVPFLKDLEETLDLMQKRSGNGALLMLHPANCDDIVADHGHAFLLDMLAGFHSRIMDLDLTSSRLLAMGPDRHGALLWGLRDPMVALLAAHKLQRLFDEPLLVNGEPLRVDVLVGIAAVNEDVDAAELARRAEVALQDARRVAEGVAFFEESQRDQFKLTPLRQRIEQGLEHAEFELYYQPKVRSSDRVPVSCEGLVRWNRDGEVVPPMAFVPIIENSPLVHTFTRQCINQGVRQAATWYEEGKHLGVSVNVPPAAVKGGQMVDIVRDALAIWSPPPELITLEITETSLMEDQERCINTLERVRELGVGVSLDDFGTGYSSLAYFRNLPATELKIDRAFVEFLAERDEDQRLVQAIIGLAMAFNMEVVAEGVETEQAAEVLATMGCDILQGYLFSRPLPVRDFDTWYSDHLETALAAKGG